MSQVSKYPIRKDVFDRIFEVFIKTLINIKNEKEAQGLISDFFTPTERIMFAKRLGIALLLEKEYDYRTIQSILKVSFPTITSVNNARKYQGKSYSLFINKILKEESIKKFLNKSLISLISVPAAGGEGSGAWKYLRRELKKKSKSSSF